MNYRNQPKKEINQLSLDDAIIICSGTNDYEPNKFSLTHHNIMSFVKSNDHTNIILINVPFRHDLPNSRSANNIISVLNRKLQKLVKSFPYMSFLKTDNDRNLFTNRVLHLNKLGKQLVHLQLASLLNSTFDLKTSHPVTFRWHEIPKASYKTCDQKQAPTSNITLSRNRIPPVTRSNDFFWQI